MIYVFLANGFEETEAIAPIDLLRRSKLEVVTVAVGGSSVTSSHGITVVPDIEEKDVIMSDKVDMIILPGGMPGTLNLNASETVQKAIDFCAENDKYIGAICAAPSILGMKNLLNGKNAICFPGFENKLIGAKISNESVCQDGNFITAKGAGVAFEFGLKLVEILTSESNSKSLKESLQCMN